jgi:hypothetical protein
MSICQQRLSKTLSIFNVCILHISLNATEDMQTEAYKNFMSIKHKTYISSFRTECENGIFQQVIINETTAFLFRSTQPQSY